MGGELQGQVQIVAVHQDADTALALNVPEQAQDLPPGDGVQGRHRLVRQQDGGVPHQGAGDGHPLLLPAGEVFHRLLQLVRQPDLSQDRGGLFGPLPSERPQQGGGQGHVRQAGVQHVLDGGQVLHQAEILIDGADPLLERPLFPASGGFKVRPAIEDFTAAAQLRSIQDAEQGGFPGAGRADDREKLAVAQGEADIPQHLAGTLKLFADMDRLQHEIPPEDGHASIDFKSAWAARSPS